MTCVGRGQGWGSVDNKLVPLRRPRGLPVTTDMATDSLITAVQGINLNSDNDHVVILKSIEDLLRSQCETEESLRSVVQSLHDRSLEDRQFGMKAAAAFATVSTLEVGSVKLRNVLLQAVQKDFEDRVHLQTACNSKFLNAISLLGEIFHRVRMPDGSPINVLATAILQYQDILLAGEEHEMELFTIQLAVNGRKLYDCKAAELEELMLRVRTTLMSRNLSGQCRCWLLLALDLASNRYAPLSGQLQSFYQIHLGANAIMQLQRTQLGLTVEVANNHTPPVTKPVENMGGGDGILTKCKAPEQTNQGITGENGVVIRPGVRVFRTNSEGGRSVTSPIEERRLSVGKKATSPVEESGPGSGGRRYNQDRNWRKNSGGARRDEDIWGTARGDKKEVWGHDDRFVKDDDFYGKQMQRGEGTSRPRNRDSTNWRERKNNEGGKEQKAPAVISKNEKPKVEVPAEQFVPPPLPEEESWD